jgi:pimeloyl-ACP methyl ester carboxylesterase
VGFSYGAVGVAVAAGLAPKLFRSLTLIEPPLTRAAFEQLAVSAASEPEGEAPADLEAALRPPWEAEPDLEAVAGAGVPALVVSGDHEPVLEEVCDSLATRLAAQRERLPGAGHAVQRTPEFNGRLERFLFAAESGTRTRSRGA